MAQALKKLQQLRDAHQRDPEDGESEDEQIDKGEDTREARKSFQINPASTIG